MSVTIAPITLSRKRSCFGLREDFSTAKFKFFNSAFFSHALRNLLNCMYLSINNSLFPPFSDSTSVNSVFSTILLDLYNSKMLSPWKIPPPPEPTSTPAKEAKPAKEPPPPPFWSSKTKVVVAV